MNIEILDAIEKITKKAPKQALLAQADEELQAMLREVLDPDVTYGVTTDQDDYSFQSQGQHMKSDKFWGQLDAFLHLCAKRELTGNAALNEMRRILAQAPSSGHIKWACRFINKNLRAGFDIRTYNLVFGAGSIEKFTVQLAQTYEGEQLVGMYAIQPKLDGNRVILLDGKAYSRNGKIYSNCQHVIDELNKRYKNFFDRWVVDGEMMGNLGFDQSSGALRRLTEDGRKKAEFTYWVFDLIDRKEWEKRKTVALHERAKNLSTMLGTGDFTHLKVVPSEFMQNPTHTMLMSACDQYLKQGFEGAMVKDVAAPYKWGRGDNLLKVKRFFDADLKVTGFYEGKGKHKGRLGGLYVAGKIDGKEYTSEVGSGFSDALRNEIWEDQRSWKNAVVQIQYQELTPKMSLRFPVFVMRRKDKE